MQFARSIFQGIALTALSLFGTSLIAAPAPSALLSFPIGTLDFKACLEKSRLGRQEIATFDALQRQMEGSMQEKMRNFEDFRAKRDDSDYIESLSNQAQAELRHKCKRLEEELTRQNMECNQILAQKQSQVMQNLQEAIQSASEAVAKQEGLAMVVNQEAFFYFAPQLDKTDAIIAQMDRTFDSDKRSQAPQTNNSRSPQQK